MFNGMQARCVLMLLAAVVAAVQADAAVLENAKIAVSIDKATGGIVSITNKATGEKTVIEDQPFSIEVGTGDKAGTVGVFTSENCKMDSFAVDDDGVRCTFTKKPVSIELSYTLAEQDAFALKKITLTYAGNEPFNINEFEMFNCSASPVPQESIAYYGFHRESYIKQMNESEKVPPSDNSVGVFLRGDKGGVFYSMTTDFVYYDAKDGKCSATYWPGYINGKGTKFESEYGIIGVYERKGLFHKPWQPQKMLTGFHFPDVDTRLDRGEIDAIRTAVKKFIKPEVSYVLVNGWGVGVPQIIKTAEDVQKYKNEIDTLSAIPMMQGLHFIHGWCGLTEEFRKYGRKMKVEPNPFAEEVFQYARSKKLLLSPFIGISNNMPMNKPPIMETDKELLSLDENGQRRDGNLALSKQYTDFAYNTISEYNRKYDNICGQTYDFLSFRPDYDSEHGYLGGRASFYPQYANLRNLNRRLRATFPDLMLRGQVGWMWLGPWLAEGMALCHNAHDHVPTGQRNFLDFHIDYQFANNVRLSNWYSANCKMYPRHKMNSNSIHNGSWIRAWDYGAFEYCVLSQIATSQAFGMLHNLPDEPAGEVFRPEDKQFFEKWVKWQIAHKDYYSIDNDLFGEPRPVGIDGYAYSNGKDSILFLCNPTYKSIKAAVPVNNEIHTASGKDYTIKELYPFDMYHTGAKDGAFAYGSEFVVEVPSQTVMVFEVKPASDELMVSGVQADISADAKGIGLSKITGPAGTTLTAAIKLPSSYSGPEKVFADGKPVKTTKQGNLLLASIQFAGEKINPEVVNVKFDTEGKRTSIVADIDVPASAKQVLAGQKMPIAKDYNNKEWLDKTAWLGWNRFVVFVAAAPGDANVDELMQKNKAMLRDFEQLIKTGSAKLNGSAITLNSHIMGSADRNRWAGFFIDASDAIKYGQKNTLEIELPKTDANRFYGLYMPNLTRQKTTEYTIMAAPNKLEMPDATGAAKAFAE